MAANALTGINALRAMTRASEQLNYPGANKLYSHLRNEDDRVLYKDVAEYVEAAAQAGVRAAAERAASQGEGSQDEEAS